MPEDELESKRRFDMYDIHGMENSDTISNATVMLPMLLPLFWCLLLCVFAGRWLEQHREASSRFMKETRQLQLKDARMRRDGERMQWQVRMFSFFVFLDFSPVLAELTQGSACYDIITLLRCCTQREQCGGESV